MEILDSNRKYFLPNLGPYANNKALMGGPIAVSGADLDLILYYDRLLNNAFIIFVIS